MSVESIVALLTPVTIIAAGIMQARANAKAAKDRTEVKETLLSVDSKTSTKLETIHKLVNSEMTRALGKIDALNNEVSSLKLRLGEEIGKAKEKAKPKRKR